MDAEEAKPETPNPSKSDAPPKDDNGSQSSSFEFRAPPPPLKSADETRSNKPLSPREFIISVASKIASQPLQNFDSNVWGVLTAISGNARKRQQVFVIPSSSVTLVTDHLHVFMVFWFWCFVFHCSVIFDLLDFPSRCDVLFGFCFEFYFELLWREMRCTVRFERTVAYLNLKHLFRLIYYMNFSWWKCV